MAELSHSVAALLDALKTIQAQSNQYAQLASQYEEYLKLYLAEAREHQADVQNFNNEYRLRDSEVDRNSSAAIEAVRRSEWFESLRHAHMAVGALPGENAWKPINAPPAPPPAPSFE